MFRGLTHLGTFCVSNVCLKFILKGQDMAHELDFSNGRANMAFTGEVPWHKLGHQLDPNATIDQWKEAAGMSWSAIASTILYEDLEGRQLKYKGRNVLYRSDTGRPLSVVSDNYKIVQPWEVLNFFKELVTEIGGFQMETAGCLRGGQRIWALAKAPKGFSLSRADVMQRYLLLATSFDKSLETTIRQTTTRVVCQNTLSVAMGSSTENFMSISHLTQFKETLVKDRIGLNEQWKLFEAAVNKLADRKITEKDARGFYENIFFPQKVKDSKWYSEKGMMRTLDKLIDCMQNGPGQNLPATKGTLWGVVNGVTFYFDHAINSRTADNRLNSAWFGDGEKFKTKVFQEALNLV